MEHDPQPEAYLLHAWIRDIHPMFWRRFLIHKRLRIRNEGPPSVGEHKKPGAAARDAPGWFGKTLGGIIGVAT